MFFFSVVLSKTNILTCTHKGIQIIKNASLQESDTYSRVFLAILIVQKKWRCRGNASEFSLYRSAINRDQLAQNAYILHKRPILNILIEKLTMNKSNMITIS